MGNIAYLSLGSNMGNRVQYLQKAIEGLCATNQVHLLNFSSLYETDPVGFIDQANFLNMVIEVVTDLSPIELLELCLSVEKELGRERIVRWGPRTIDLDILLYNQENIKTEKLTVPHPRMKERAFVLIPLAEIQPDLKIPGQEASVSELANRLRDEGVRLWSMKNGEDVFELFGN